MVNDFEMEAILITELGLASNRFSTSAKPKPERKGSFEETIFLNKAKPKRKGSFKEFIF
jgi:hypothetical protein